MKIYINVTDVANDVTYSRKSVKLIHVWSYDFYDMTLSTGKKRRHMIISYDIAFFQCITLCNKNYDLTCINTFFFIQFNVPFKFISAHMRRANQKVGRKRVNPEKNHTHTRHSGEVIE